MSHEGPVRINFHRTHYSVTCPFGHIVTGGMLDSNWGGSWIEAKISAHQSGYSIWRVECDGALPGDPS